MSYYALVDSDWPWDDESEGRPIIVHADTPEEAVRIATEKHRAESSGSGGICWSVSRLWSIGSQMVDWNGSENPNYGRFDYYKGEHNGPMDVDPSHPSTN